MNKPDYVPIEELKNEAFKAGEVGSYINVAIPSVDEGTSHTAKKKHVKNPHRNDSSGVEVYIGGVRYVQTEAGSLVRLTHKLNQEELLAHNKSVRRRLAKGKF